MKKWITEGEHVPFLSQAIGRVPHWKRRMSKDVENYRELVLKHPLSTLCAELAVLVSALLRNDGIPIETPVMYKKGHLKEYRRRSVKTTGCFVLTSPPRAFRYPLTCLGCF